FTREIATLRAGRASVSFLEGIVVDYYGSKLPINQLATVTIPQPQLIVIQPWDKTITEKIVKAIQASNLGLNPQPDSNAIRIAVPPLSEERRRELVKVLSKMTEEAKVELRELRRKANEELKASEKAKEISEDDLYRAMDEIKKIMDKMIQEIEKKAADKEKEIMED
ncbi:MAG: ribosome recycling factor, partial [Candidatus Omnitrophica bacterium]|nr:ribosome recycling factor [Candidatus Omnitrophota bacterium]